MLGLVRIHHLIARPRIGLPDVEQYVLGLALDLVGTQVGGRRGRGREDITDHLIVTVDPPDAQDFDDAISLIRSRRGNWILGVHIADVSHFVPPGSALDQGARLRGNSVYLPGRTLPMLPEMLSNDLCSLQLLECVWSNKFCDCDRSRRV